MGDFLGGGKTEKNRQSVSHTLANGMERCGAVSMDDETMILTMVRFCIAGKENMKSVC